MQTVSGVSVLTEFIDQIRYALARLLVEMIVVPGVVA